MTIIEVLLLLLVLGACVYMSVSDIKEGMIPNRVILGLIVTALILDACYYVIAPELLFSFGINLAIITAIALLMYATHTWAGGDCKFFFVIGLLYPAGCYLPIAEMNSTLCLSWCFAFIAGFIYLAIDSAVLSLKKGAKIRWQPVRGALLSFVKRYALILVYTSGLYLIYVCFVAERYAINDLLLMAVFIGTAFCVSGFSFFQDKILLSAVLIFDLALSLIFMVSPLRIGPLHFLVLFFVVALRLMIAGHNYKEIPTSEVKKGMILATSSTITFSRSQVKGLPKLSTEDLRSRLTEAESESVRRWEKSKYGSQTVQIVRKIPFAIFISIGVFCYFILWGILK